MNISQKEAQDSLDQVQTVAKRTQKSISASYDSGLLIMWGLICTAGYLGTHFFLEWVWYIWSGLCGLGCMVTFWVCWRQFRFANPIKVPPADKTVWRIFSFWCLIFIYMFIWLSILKPFHGIQLNAFMVTIIMFAYIVMGLWFKSYHMFWLGIVVTAVTLTGFYLIPWNYYCFWMAAMVGGAFLITGFYIRLRWI